MKEVRDLVKEVNEVVQEVNDVTEGCECGKYGRSRRW